MPHTHSQRSQGAMTQTLYACHNTQSTVAKNLLLVYEMVIDSSKSRKNLAFFENSLKNPPIFKTAIHEICSVRYVFAVSQAGSSGAKRKQDTHAHRIWLGACRAREGKKRGGVQSFRKKLPKPHALCILPAFSVIRRNFGR